MYRFFLSSFVFIMPVFAATPILYSFLGDKIYSNSVKIKKLSYIDSYKYVKSDINNYLKKVKKVKKEGFSLKNNTSVSAKKHYLYALRNLAKENDSFIRTTEDNFEKYIEKENTTSLIKMIDTGLINLDLHKQEIMDYYFLHKKDMKDDELFIKFLNKYKMLKMEKKIQVENEKKRRSKEQKSLEVLRDRDKLKQNEIKNQLNQSLKKKKRKLKKAQKDELSKII